MDNSRTRCSELMDPSSLCLGLFDFGPPPGLWTPSSVSRSPEAGIQAPTAHWVLIHPCHALLAFCLHFLLPPFLGKPTALSDCQRSSQGVAGGAGRPLYPTNVSTASSSLPPSPRQLRSLGTRLGPRVQVTVGGFINHYGAGGALAGPRPPVLGAGAGWWGPGVEEGCQGTNSRNDGTHSHGKQLQEKPNECQWACSDGGKLGGGGGGHWVWRYFVEEVCVEPGVQRGDEGLVVGVSSAGLESPLCPLSLEVNVVKFPSLSLSLT